MEPNKQIYVIQSYDGTSATFNPCVIAFSYRKACMDYCKQHNVDNSTILYSFVAVTLIA